MLDRVYVDILSFPPFIPPYQVGSQFRKMATPSFHGWRVNSGGIWLNTSRYIIQGTRFAALDKNHFLVFGARTATPPSCPSGRTVLEHWLQEVTRIPVAGLWRFWCLVGHAKYSVHILSRHNTKPDDPLMVVLPGMGGCDWP